MNHRPQHHSGVGAGGAARRLRHASRRRAQEAEAPPRQHWSFARAVRHVRSGAAAARLQDLSRGLFELPQHQAPGIPQSRRSRRPRLHRGAGRGDRGRVPGHRRSKRSGPDVPAAGPDRRSFPAAVPERSGRPRGPRRRAAAGHVRACQGAQLRGGFPLVHYRCVHGVPGGWPGLHSRHRQRLYGSACRFHAAAGRTIQQIFSRAMPSACPSR